MSDVYSVMRHLSLDDNPAYIGHFANDGAGHLAYEMSDSVELENNNFHLFRLGKSAAYTVRVEHIVLSCCHILFNTYALSDVEGTTQHI
jgi:hypothetical protein